MGLTLRSPKDFSLGILYTAIGAVGFLIGTDYPFGSAARMGAGFFPLVISGILFLFGIASMMRSLRLEGTQIEKVALRPMALVIGSAVIFGLLVNRAGLAPASFVLLVMSAAASSEFGLKWRPLLGAALLAATSALLFVSGLGIPIPIFGPWLTR